MFNNDEIVTEITETEAVTHLTAVQVVEVTCWTVGGLWRFLASLYMYRVACLLGYPTVAIESYIQ